MYIRFVDGSLLERHLNRELAEALTAFRLVVLGGARQAGKTTLLRASTALDTVTLDEPATLDIAVADPTGFLQSLSRPTAIDEFQRGGEPLLLAIKSVADLSRQRGQFVLSGSANYLANRSISETLAGRAARLTLWPLSLGERHGVRETFIDRLFEPDSWPPPVTPSLRRTDAVDLIIEGGYPEIVTEHLSSRARRLWFEAYLGDVVSREALRAIAEVRMEDELRRVFRLLAARTAHELVVSDVARDAGIHRTTCANYIALLQALYLIVVVPAWATSATTRAKRHPKVLVCDSGLAADVCGIGPAAFGIPGSPAAAGALFETLVLTELHKQAGWSERHVDLSHFRDRDGAEVDCIVEDRRTAEVAGVEVKFTSTPRERDARHLALLRNRLGDRFRTGLVVHTGDRVLPLGDRLWAVLLGSLLRAD